MGFFDFGPFFLFILIGLDYIFINLFICLLVCFCPFALFFYGIIYWFNYLLCLLACSFGPFLMESLSWYLQVKLNFILKVGCKAQYFKGIFHPHSVCNILSAVLDTFLFIVYSFIYFLPDRTSRYLLTGGSFEKQLLKLRWTNQLIHH